MAVRRAAYRRAGGHAAVRAELLEDTQLARRLKAAGGRVVPALGQGCVEVTMYRSYRESLGGFGKNALGVHLDSRALLLGLGLWHLLAYTLPWLRPASPGVWALRVAGLSERALVNLVSGRRRVPDLAEGLLGPLTPLLALPATPWPCAAPCAGRAASTRRAEEAGRVLAASAGGVDGERDRQHEADAHHRQGRATGLFQEQQDADTGQGNEGEGEAAQVDGPAPARPRVAAPVQVVEDGQTALLQHVDRVLPGLDVDEGVGAVARGQEADVGLAPVDRGVAGAALEALVGPQLLGDGQPVDLALVGPARRQRARHGALDLLDAQRPLGMVQGNAADREEQDDEQADHAGVGMDPAEPDVPLGLRAAPAACGPGLRPCRN
ncbi:Glycosyl transferase, family 2 [Deinococcus gobiensis I-0]|uniref:Glycosyl transferase, family 2 n=1 Tax=Deinococcus gobiensis (strain DSM 21396 / JCM 16679 / CGMCC 1.7299 / I-0) TaxID=745776 RepID=H8GXK3_DEIGI|nr:Glycosyl transferase, family 2 [Deinococcus gobiensis I-0]